jgi:hypothetical protein
MQGMKSSIHRMLTGLLNNYWADDLPIRYPGLGIQIIPEQKARTPTVPA